MKSALPSNETLVAFSSAVPWNTIEEQKRKFTESIEKLVKDGHEGELPLEAIADVLQAPVTTFYDSNESRTGNMILAEVAGYRYILGSYVSQRYRGGKSVAESVVTYNLNPSVNHTNIHETDDPSTRIRALGAELELGLLHPDGSAPTEAQMQEYIRIYKNHAHRIGITPQVDREACMYQIEAHVAPGIGYARTRQALDGIMSALIASSNATGLHTAIMSSYPIESDFRLTNDQKVYTAVDLMVELNQHFPEYVERLSTAKTRYHIPQEANVVEVFRLQGCHIHLDLAGRSEGLAMLTFHTMLRSATAIANSAVLKGGPFVNGTCDEELLCAREYLRTTTVTGRYIEKPLSPHLIEGDMERYGKLLLTERANAMARALLYEDGLTEPISAMHNPIGRVRPDLQTSKRICTVESTGMPINVSASRQAAVLTDFEFTHALIESYFRRHGCDLTPMMEDTALWEILGPLSEEEFTRLHHLSDRECSDITLKTAIGTEMSLADFYEKKRVYMHKHLTDLIHIAPRDIDDVYMSLQRMLTPPAGHQAETVEQYVNDYKLRSTGNWGKILRNAFIEEGGVPGSHNPDAVLRVVNRIHEALRTRYQQN
ncbi:MAG: hypothetical protein OHK0046_50020 [Anaerolineae bacterium]